MIGVYDSTHQVFNVFFVYCVLCCRRCILLFYCLKLAWVVSRPLPLLLALVFHNSAAFSYHLAGVAGMPTRVRLVIGRSCRKNIPRFSTIGWPCSQPQLALAPVDARESRPMRGGVGHGRCLPVYLSPDPLLMHRFFARTARFRFVRDGCSLVSPVQVSYC